MRAVAFAALLLLVSCAADADQPEVDAAGRVELRAMVPCAAAPDDCPGIIVCYASGFDEDEGPHYTCVEADVDALPR